MKLEDYIKELPCLFKKVLKIEETIEQNSKIPPVLTTNGDYFLRVDNGILTWVEQIPALEV